MDEGAVSSDPVLAFLLDEVVVKDWCACSFEKIVEELRDICILNALNGQQFFYLSLLCVFVRFWCIFYGVVRCSLPKRKYYLVQIDRV